MGPNGYPLSMDLIHGPSGVQYAEAPPHKTCAGTGPLTQLFKADLRGLSFPLFSKRSRVFLLQLWFQKVNLFVWATELDQKNGLPGRIAAEPLRRVFGGAGSPLGRVSFWRSCGSRSRSRGSWAASSARSQGPGAVIVKLVGWGGVG